jgi:hypothetical protein
MCTDYQVSEADLFAIFARQHPNSSRVKLFIDLLATSIAHLGE